LQLNRQVLGEEHPNTIASLFNLGLVYAGEGRNEEAAALLQKALQSSASIYGKDHYKTIEIAKILLVLYRRSGRILEAKSLSEKYVDSLE
jgi:tetratricopeptide (TPR) repeat protein